jgi:hypothetical protein
MLAILFVAASLLTQAYIFRNLDVPESNTQVNIVPVDAALIPVSDASDGSSGESDSSRIADRAHHR